MADPATTQAAMLQPQDWSFPVPIAYGPGRLREIGAICGERGIRTPLVVTDRGSRDLPFVARLTDALDRAGMSWQLFSGISPNPRDVEIGAGRDCFRGGGHDAVIAIGGGSALDGAKAICLTARNDIDLWDFEFEKPAPDLPGGQAFPPLFCIPTTAGTGAETESTAMVTRVDLLMKFCVWHPRLKPALALLDPDLTVELPRTLTAWTGADALTHAIEAYSVPGFSPLCDGVALEGLRLVAKWLPVAVEDPRNQTARGGMLAGSCLAGVAFQKGLGLVHAISHMIGAEFDTQHGLTNAILLPPVLRFNLESLGDKSASLAEAMGLRERSGDALVGSVEGLLDRIGIPPSLGEIGVPAGCGERIARKAMQDSAFATNPRRATVEEIAALVEQAVVRARP